MRFLSKATNYIVDNTDITCLKINKQASTRSEGGYEVKQLRRPQIGNLFLFQDMARVISTWYSSFEKVVDPLCTRQVGGWDAQPFSLSAS